MSIRLSLDVKMGHRFRWLMLTCLALLLLQGCRTGENARRLRAIDASAQSHPDNALVLLRAVPQEALTTQALQARYSLLHAKLLYKNFIDTTDLAIIAPARSYFARHGSTQEKMETAYYTGCILQNRKEFTEAVIELGTAARLAQQCGDRFTEGLICATLSILYTELHNYLEEYLYAERAVSCFAEAGNEDYRQYAAILQGIALHNQRHFAEAEAIYRDILENGNPDRANRQDAMAHLALTQAARKDIRLAEADSLFKQVLAETGDLPSRNMWGAYAFVQDRLGRRAEADAIYARLDTTDVAVDGWYSRSLGVRREYRDAFYRLLRSVEQQSELLNVALTQATQKALRERSESLREQAETRNRTQRNIFILSILAVLSAAVALFLLIRRRYERTREENLRLTQMAEHIHNRMQEMEQAASNAASSCTAPSLQEEYIRLYQSRFKEIGILYENLLYAETHGNGTQAILASVRRMVNDIIRQDADGRRFEAMLNEKLDGVMTRFRQDFPGRPETDYRLMGFVIAGFDATTVTLLLNMPSAGAAYTRKSRLKQTIAAAGGQKSAAYLRYF